MSLSSGGLMLLALSSNNILPFVFSQREYVLWYLTWFGLCCLAYITNPTAATFRTHLTSLSFESHLRRLSSSLPRPDVELKDSTPMSRKVSEAGQETTSHILSFSNRISLSIRTPPYSVKSYYIFSLVVMAAAPRIEMIDKNVKLDEEEGQVLSVWIGAFGRWYSWNAGGDHAQEEERKLRLDRGVVSMKVKDIEPSTPTISVPSTPTENETPISPISPSHSSTSTNSTRLPRSNKRVIRQGERRPSPTSLARLRSRTESSSTTNLSSTSPSILSITSHIKNQSEGDGFYTTRSPKERGLPGLPFHISRSHPPTLPGHFSIDSNPPDSESTVGSSAVKELKVQLQELKTSSEENEKRLEIELEGLKEKKKEEDGFRAELKGKTKLLEEEKRLAELSKVESERALGEKKVGLKGVEEQVDKIKDEIIQIDRREFELVERKEKKKRDRREREKKMREDIIRKKEELQIAQVSLEKMKTKTTGLGFTLESRREVLLAKKNEMAARGYVVDNDYRRGNGLLPYHPGMTSSRPSSRNFNLQSGGHSSAPTSPSIAYRTSGYEDDYIPTPYGGTSAAENSTFYSNNFIHPTNSTGFLEHRIQHRQHASVNSTFIPLSGSLPSTEAIEPKFLPFNFDFGDSPGPIEPIPLPSTESSSIQKSRAPLSLPLQYLESGLLSGEEDSGSNYVPMSPVTPHQTSLIPSKLLSMIDADDDEEDQESLSPLSATRSGPGEGLGLEVSDADGTGWEGMTDLNRFGIGNLNPDAKTFKFIPGHTSSTSTGSTKSFISKLDYSGFEEHRPIKSRMDFALPISSNHSSSNSTGSMSNFKFDPFSEDDDELLSKK